MNAGQKETIKQNLPRLAASINYESLFVRLRERTLVTEDDYHVIQGQNPLPRGRTIALLERVKTKDNGFEGLLEGLDECEHKDLAILLENYYRNKVAASNDITPCSDPEKKAIKKHKRNMVEQLSPHMEQFVAKMRASGVLSSPQVVAEIEAQPTSGGKITEILNAISENGGFDRLLEGLAEVQLGNLVKDLQSEVDQCKPRPPDKNDMRATAYQKLQLAAENEKFVKFALGALDKAARILRTKNVIKSNQGFNNVVESKTVPEKMRALCAAVRPNDQDYNFFHVLHDVDLDDYATAFGDPLDLKRETE